MFCLSSWSDSSSTGSGAKKNQGRRVEVDLGIVCGWMRGRGWILLGTFSCSVAIKRQLTLLTWAIMRPDKGQSFKLNIANISQSWGSV